MTKPLSHLIRLGLAAALIGACSSSADLAAQEATTSSESIAARAQATAAMPAGVIGTTIPTPEQLEATHAIPALLSGQAAFGVVGMATSQVGWATGSSQRPLNRVLRTEDGGLTWRDASPPEELLAGGDTAIEVEGFFLDADHAWVTYYDPWDPPSSAYVWFTIDGGETWAESAPLTLGMTGDTYRADLAFSDVDTGRLASVSVVPGMGGTSFNMIFRTADGGRTWQGQSLDSYGVTGVAAAPGDPLRAMITQFVPSAAYGWAIEFFATYDGGSSWRAQELPAPAAQTGLFSDYDRCYASSPALLASGAALAVVTCEDNGGDPVSFISRTTDDWSTASAFRFSGGSLLFVDSTGWALGRQIYQSLDGGQSWTQIKTVNWDGQFSFIDSSEGWAVATRDEGSALVHTTDGGRSWEILEAVVAGVDGAEPGTAGPSIWPTDPDCQIGFLTARDDLTDPIPDLFSMGCDGSDPVRLTDGAWWVMGFDWSPDGQRIALIRTYPRSGDSALCVMSADGTGLAEISPALYDDGAPSWSPDGRWIAFVGEAEAGDFGDYPVMVIAPDGSGAQALTQDLLTTSPTWSPDGTRIAFATWAGQIYVMNADGSGLTKISDPPGSMNHVHWMDWSPDGRQLLFVAGDSHGESYPPLDLYTLATDGRGGPNLVAGDTSDFGGTWCPDSSCIVFAQGDSRDNARLFVINVDGSNLRPFPGDNRGFSPQWRP